MSSDFDLQDDRRLDGEARPCARCDRPIEECAFCQSDRCEDWACYRCVIVDLREFAPHPHPHGG